jgi:hypothetical protein
VGDPPFRVLDRRRRQRLDGSRQARHRRGELDPADFVGGDVAREGDESTDLLDVAHIGQQRLEPAPGPATVEHAVPVRGADALAVRDLHSDHGVDIGLVVGMDERASIAGEPAVVAETHQSRAGSIDRALPAGLVEHRDHLGRSFEDLLQHPERWHGVRTVTGEVSVVDHAEVPLVVVDGDRRQRQFVDDGGAVGMERRHRERATEPLGVPGPTDASEPCLVRAPERGWHDELRQRPAEGLVGADAEQLESALAPRSHDPVAVDHDDGHRWRPCECFEGERWRQLGSSVRFAVVHAAPVRLARCTRPFVVLDSLVAGRSIERVEGTQWTPGANATS